MNSYLDAEKGAVTLNVTFASLGNGLSANIVLLAPEKKIQVVVQNSNYQRIAATAQPSPPQPQGMMAAPQGQVIPAAPQGTQAQALSPQAIDSLTAPIALYPDALVAQILTASTNFWRVPGEAAAYHPAAVVVAGVGAGVVDAYDRP